MKTKKTMIVLVASCLLSVVSFAQSKKGESKSKFPTKGETPMEQSIEQENPEKVATYPVASPSPVQETAPVVSTSSPEVVVPVAETPQSITQPSEVIRLKSGRKTKANQNQEEAAEGKK